MPAPLASSSSPTPIATESCNRHCVCSGSCYGDSASQNIFPPRWDPTLVRAPQPCFIQTVQLLIPKGWYGRLTSQQKRYCRFTTSFATLTIGRIMDGLSGAASIITVADISAKVASLCFQYSVAVKDAKKDIENLQMKITSVKNALEEVRRLLDTQDKS
jgi:hypothetical protein